ncbi:MAG: polysaccharide biosynthesis protein [Deltaproteobacteria bacterium]|nr:polysaccharide biosynthesis protein [Deltaproteobacteria bacterium]
MKRAFDIFLASIGLILLSPVLAIVALLVKMSSPGPVLFAQKRVGRNLRPFNLCKFRTMVSDAPGKGRPITADNDPRVTRLGRILRKTKIDELPQLLNVLEGDMSFVGPRPEVLEYVGRHREDYEEILKIRPGITDIASLIYSDEEAVLKGKEDLEGYYVHVLLPEKIKLAREYVRKASLLYDLKLISLTISKLTYPYETVLKMINALSPYRRTAVIGIQLGIFIASNYLAFLVRFDAGVPSSQIHLFLRYLPLLLSFRIFFLFVFSLDRGLWRYASIRDLRGIAAATSLGSLSFVLGTRYLAGNISYPRSVFIIDWFLNVFLLGGIRIFKRLHEKASDKRMKKRGIVIGAGDAAEMLLRDIEQSRHYPYEVVGLIDDNPGKKGLRLRGVSIFGARKDLAAIVEREKPDEFIIAMPSTDPLALQGIVKDLRQYGKPIKTLPGLRDILSGRDSLSRIKPVEPEDILFRAPVRGNGLELKGFFEGRRVMITGAGGSIGAELSRQIASFNPGKLVLFERHEESLYEIGMELNTLFANPSFIAPVIGDILDEKRVAGIMERFRPEIVLHAAAYKHVPLMEGNPSEAFKTNIMGTRMIAEKAKDFDVERFVLISTDKAVNPVNIMGMTKKVAEEIIGALSESAASTKFVTVRFGNVLESSGSVVPLFREQIKRGGPVTVTHPEITRYFMTIPEAVGLVLRAATMGRGGEVFVLEMGKVIKILDLAKRMIGLYGYRPGIDMDITFTGLRPGEKLHEELFNGCEMIEKTPHPGINKAISSGYKQDVLTTLDSMMSIWPLMENLDIKNTLTELVGQKT